MFFFIRVHRLAHPRGPDPEPVRQLVLRRGEPGCQAAPQRQQGQLRRPHAQSLPQ